MDEIIKGLQWIKENQAYGVSGACDDLIEKCKKLTTSQEVVGNKFLRSCNMTEKEKAIAIIKNIIDYNGIEPWGRALRYAVKELEEKLTMISEQKAHDL